MGNPIASALVVGLSAVSGFLFVAAFLVYVETDSSGAHWVSRALVLLGAVAMIAAMRAARRRRDELRDSREL